MNISNKKKILKNSTKEKMYLNTVKFLLTHIFSFNNLFFKRAFEVRKKLTFDINNYSVKNRIWYKITEPYILLKRGRGLNPKNKPH